MPYSQALIKPCNPNGYCYNTYAPPAPNGYQQMVPTGKLIEVESHNGSYDMVDNKSSYKSRNFESPNTEYHKTKSTNEITNNLIDTSSDKKDSQLEDWGYVYRNLESQGYSKDLGERGDLLSPSSIRHAKEIKKVKATNLDEDLNNLVVNDRPLKTSESFNRKSIERRRNDEIALIDKDNSSASSYDNVHAEEIKKQNKPSASNNVIMKNLQKERHNVTEKVPQNKDDRSNKKKFNASSPPLDSAKWQCKSCTFLNDAAKDICDICCKSRVVTSEPPMEIGGAECPKCTLVNPKNLKVCEACDGSLENSPTYI